MGSGAGGLPPVGQLQQDSVRISVPFENVNETADRLQKNEVFGHGAQACCFQTPFGRRRSSLVLVSFVVHQELKNSELSSE